jgi:hypothetical protein
VVLFAFLESTSPAAVVLLIPAALAAENLSPGCLGFLASSCFEADVDSVAITIVGCGLGV